MPIKFRCPHCEQFLGISRSKAGAVTDCPMCGRTIRVPQLDGKVAPLPKPELNHGDSGLAKALDALASLGDGNATVVEAEPKPAKAVAISLAPAPALEPVPIPVPLPPEPPGSPASGGISRPTPPPWNASGTAAPQVDPLRELSQIAPPAGFRVHPSSRNQRLLVTGGLCGLLGIIAGFLLGRATGSNGPTPQATPAGVVAEVPSPSGQPVVGTVPAGDTAPSSPSATGELKLAIEGRVTYVTLSGESRPDAGARILVIPAQRLATAKLSVMSFRAGANSGDLKLAQASLRSLGGDYVLAGPDGHYEIRLPATGKYQLLIVSKYQGREPDRELDRASVAVIENWFDQPRAFFGQTQSMLAEIQFDGQRSSIRDHVFPKGE